MSTKGQTINDRLNAAKYTLAGRSLARCICKATTEELSRPKKKHLDCLAAFTHETDISMLQLANLLIERTNHSNWVVVYKALITVHHLLSNGSEKFIQYLASSNHSFVIDGSLDKIASKGFAMSTFIRRYSVYIDQKSLAYKCLAIDLCRKPRSKSNLLREMPITTLLKTLPVAQKQLDVLLDFGAAAADLNNSIIVACFTLLFHDAIRLFASYNDGIINLFEKYFDLNRKMCRDAFEAYKKFLNCTDRVADFLKIAQTIGLDTGGVPDFRRAPSSLLDALEQHLLSLESNKKRNKVAIDTSAVTVPSFSISLEFEPSMSEVAKELDTQLTFASTDSSGFFEPNNSVGISQNNQVQPATQEANISATQIPQAIPRPVSTSSPSPTTTAMSKQDHASKTIDELKQNLSFPSPGSLDSGGNIDECNTKTLSDVDTGRSGDVFDAKPPGYSGGTMLTPEFTLQTQFDPSIDPMTQQQLIQIQREQASYRKNPNSPIGPNSSVSGQTNKESPIMQGKKKYELIFEDLEQSMRQQLTKVGRA